jgi:hypothetical protein
VFGGHTGISLEDGRCDGQRTVITMESPRVIGAFAAKPNVNTGNLCGAPRFIAATIPRLGSHYCPDCYDYTTHVLFNWHAPELLRRFTIALRRAVAAQMLTTMRPISAK